jgi:hypothetical protein
LRYNNFIPMPESHNPDIIYLEADSEITEAIDKFKAAKAHEVRVAVPARSTLLQSAVNIKLLKKAATGHHKNLVLVSNDKATISLAAGLGVLVAKNVKADAAVPEMAAEAMATAGAHEPVVIEEEVEQAAASSKKDKKASKDSQSFQKQHIPLSEEAEQEAKHEPEPHHTPTPVGDLPKDKRVPNFKTLNKKIFGIVVGIVVVILLILAYIFLPTAKVTLVAKAQKTPVNVKFSLDSGTKKSNFSSGDIAAEQVATTKALSGQFSATGQKDIGQKATGSVAISNAASSSSVAVPAGTTFSAAGKNFTLNQGVTVPGASVSGGHIVPGTANGSVTAAQNGDSYNISNANFAIAGFSGLSANGSTSGGVSHVAQVVSQADVDKAKQALIESATANAKTELQSKAGDNERVFEQTLVIEAAAVTSSIPVDGEATTATLNAQVKFSELAAANNDLDTLFKTQIQSQIPGGNEIYQSGASDATYTLVKSFGADKADMSAVGNAFYGQTIDKNQVAHDVAGKSKKDATDAVAPKYPQVTQVQVESSPSLMPNLPYFANRITVEIRVQTN